MTYVVSVTHVDKEGNSREQTRLVIHLKHRDWKWHCSTLRHNTMGATVRSCELDSFAGGGIWNAIADALRLMNYGHKRIKGRRLNDGDDWGRQYSESQGRPYARTKYE